MASEGVASVSWIKRCVRHFAGIVRRCSFCHACLPRGKDDNRFRL